MGNIEEVLDLTEFNGLLKENKLILIDFYASWCAPCKMQMPILIEFKQEMDKKVKIIKVDVDQNPEIANKYKVQMVPTIILFQNKIEKEKCFLFA